MLTQRSPEPCHSFCRPGYQKAILLTGKMNLADLMLGQVRTDQNDCFNAIHQTSDSHSHTQLYYFGYLRCPEFTPLSALKFKLSLVIADTFFKHIKRLKIEKISEFLQIDQILLINSILDFLLCGMMHALDNRMVKVTMKCLFDCCLWLHFFLFLRKTALCCCCLHYVGMQMDFYSLSKQESQAPSQKCVFQCRPKRLITIAS